MPNYEFSEEKDGLRFLAYGSTLEQAFSNAASALHSVIKNPTILESKAKRVVELNAGDLESLAWDWLEHLLRMPRVDSFVIKEARVMRVTKEDGGYTLRAKLFGDNSVHDQKTLQRIKRIAHSEVRYDNMNNRWIVEVLINI